MHNYIYTAHYKTLRDSSTSDILTNLHKNMVQLFSNKASKTTVSEFDSY